VVFHLVGIFEKIFASVSGGMYLMAVSVKNVSDR